MNKVSNWSEEALMGTYLGGLHPSISDNVRMFSPKTLKTVINLARLHDDQLQRQKRTFTPRTHMTQTSSSPNNRAVIPSHSQTTTTTTRDSSQQVPKRLSWEEMRRKRSLGLCFSCDEKYTQGHRCRTSQLLLMAGADVDDTDDDVFHEVEEPEITL